MRGPFEILSSQLNGERLELYGLEGQISLDLRQLITQLVMHQGDLIADGIVNAILADLRSRDALQGAWDSIDPGTQEEVRTKWRALVLEKLQ